MKSRSIRTHKLTQNISPWLIYIFTLMFAAFSVSCSVQTEILGVENSQTLSLLRLESQPDGAGSLIEPDITLSLGQTIHIYSVKRNGGGVYISNPEVTWIYNGDIGPLAIDQNGRHASLTVTSTGSAQIKTNSEGLNYTINIVSTSLLPQVSFSVGSQNVNEGTTVALPANWYSPLHANRRKLTLNNSAQTTALNDFPVMIKLNSSRIDYTKTKDAGEDLRFYGSDGSALSYQIESWDEAGDSIVWVKVPQIDASSNSNFIWMFYNDVSLADGQTPAAVWNSTYKGVWHLTQGSDSTGVNNGTLQGPDTILANPLGSAQHFVGGVDNIDLGNDASLELNFPVTMSAWVNAGSFTDANIFTTDHTNGAYTGVKLTINSSGYVAAGYGDGGNCSGSYRKDFAASTNQLSVGTWYQVTAVLIDPTTYKLYVNGDEVSGYAAPSGSAISVAHSGGTARIGQMRGGCGAPGAMAGDLKIDEVRVENIVSSPDWIKAQYLSTSDSSFVNYGTEEGLLAPGAPTSVTVTAQIDKTSPTDVIIPITVSGTATKPGDHNLDAIFDVTIIAGQLSQDFVFELVTDIINESDETVVLTMGAPADAILGNISEQTVNIINDDGPPNISVSDLTATEGQTAQVVLQLSNSFNSLITVDYATSNGSAVSPGDYTSTSGTATIPLGFNYITIDVPTFTDESNEGTEDFFVNISNASIGTITDSQAKVDLEHNFAPAATDDSPFTVPMTTLSVLSGMLDNDIDADGDTPIVFAAVSSEGASVTVGSDTTINYTPAPGFYGVDIVTYTISDGRGGQDTANFNVQVMSPFTWVGLGGNNSWLNPLNWCGDVVAQVCQGNIGPPNKATEPGSVLNPGSSTAQRAVFNSSCLICNVNIDASVDVEGFEMMEDYVGTISQNNNSMDIEDFGLIVNSVGGIFNGDTIGATIDTKKFQLLAGSFTSTNNSLIVGGDTYANSYIYKVFEIAAGATFTTQANSNLHFKGFKTGNFSPMFQAEIPSNLILNNLIFEGSATSYNDSYRSRFGSVGSGKFVINGSLDLRGGELEVGEFDLKGNLLLADTVSRSGAATVNLVGTGTQFYACTTNCGSPLVVIDDPSITFSPSQGGTVHFWGLFVQQGTFNAVTAGSIYIGIGAYIPLPGGGTMDLFKLGATANYNVNSSHQYFTVRGTWDNYTNYNITLDKDINLENVTMYAGGSGSLSSSLLTFGTGKYIVNGNITFSPSGNGWSGYNGTYDVYGNFVSPSVSWAGGPTGFLVNFLGSNVQTLTTTSGYTMSMDIVVNKSGGSLNLLSDYRLGTKASGSQDNLDLHLISGTINVGGFDLQIGDLPGGETDSVLSLESGTILNLGGGTLTYETLVNNGATINP